MELTFPFRNMAINDLLRFIDAYKFLESRGTGAPFLLFRNEQERKGFNKYVMQNTAELARIENTFWGKQAFKAMKQAGNESVINPLFLDKIKQLHQMWTLKNI